MIAFVNYSICRHKGVVVHQPCESPANYGHSYILRVRAIGNDYCPSYFLLPDPRINEVERGAHDPLLHPGFGLAQHAEVLSILDRAAELDTSDILAFVRTKFQRVTKGMRNLMEYNYEILLNDFWWRLLHLRLPPPTEKHCMLILQIRTYYEHHIYGKHADKDSLEQYRISMWKETNEKVDIEPLEDDELNCVVCYEQFGVIDSDGIMEVPVRTNNPDCPQIFGENCLLTWLKDNKDKASCPCCRCVLRFISDEETEAPMSVELQLGLSLCMAST